jgi:hypothetical protein
MLWSVVVHRVGSKVSLLRAPTALLLTSFDDPQKKPPRFCKAFYRGISVYRTGQVKVVILLYYYYYFIFAGCIKSSLKNAETKYFDCEPEPFLGFLVCV